MVTLVFIFLFHLFNKSYLIRSIKIWINLYAVICFFILSASPPYFNYNFSHLTIALFNWIDTPLMMIKQVIFDWRYLFYFFVYIISVVGFVQISKKIFAPRQLLYLPFHLNLLFFLLLSAITFLGMRGRISAPLKESNATICGDPYVNQLPFNSVFTFVKSVDYQVHFYSNEEALLKTKHYLGVNDSGLSITRAYIYETDSLTNPNIILILMESMTTCNLKENLTPFLDSLSKHSLFFPNTWSAGKHTSNGIFSTLYGYPAIWSRRATSTSNKISYCGLPGTLKKNGYYNLFFCTHDLSFDNLAEFLPYNYFDTAIAQSHYPKEEVVGMYGVPDHVMFREGSKVLNSLSKQPFFAVFLTSSNHGPYTLPNNIPFTPLSQTIEFQMVEYTDWALQYFFNLTKKTKWFNNTLFIFVADHGFVVKKEKTYIPLCAHQIPLIFYSPKFIKEPKISNKLASQMDVFPTVMGILKKSFLNQSFGIDLTIENRPYVFYSNDKELICKNDSFMYVFGKGNRELLFILSNPEECVLKRYPTIAKQMKEYMLTQLQVSVLLSDSKRTYCE